MGIRHYAQLKTFKFIFLKQYYTPFPHYTLTPRLNPSHDLRNRPFLTPLLNLPQYHQPTQLSLFIGLSIYSKLVPRGLVLNRLVCA